MRSVIWQLAEFFRKRFRVGSLRKGCGSPRYSQDLLTIGLPKPSTLNPAYNPLNPPLPSSRLSRRQGFPLRAFWGGGHPKP